MEHLSGSLAPGRPLTSEMKLLLPADFLSQIVGAAQTSSDAPEPKPCLLLHSCAGVLLAETGVVPSPEAVEKLATSVRQRLQRSGARSPSGFGAYARRIIPSWSWSSHLCAWPAALGARQPRPSYVQHYVVRGSLAICTWKIFGPKWAWKIVNFEMSQKGLRSCHFIENPARPPRLIYCKSRLAGVFLQSFSPILLHHSKRAHVNGSFSSKNPFLVNMHVHVDVRM